MLRPLPTYNPALPFLLSDWNGNPVNEKNRYINIDGPSERSYGELLKWQFSSKPLKKLKRNQQPNIRVKQGSDFLLDRSEGFTWLGHASFLLTLSGRHFLVDPVLYDVSIVKRYTAFPCPVADLKNIDYILISHNHRDHCDRKSLQEIAALNPRALLITGLETSRLLRRWSIRNPVLEMGWYQQWITEEGIRISYLPARHWNRRGLTDLNDMLWGSFMLQNERQNWYFGADSGMGDHFADIGHLFPKIDFAMLGIGAYMPEWFMHTSHTGPGDALRAKQLLGAASMIPMHFGTFDLSDEPVYFAHEELMRLAATYPENPVTSLDIGEKFHAGA